MGLDNDTRGWIMTAVSGIACCFGASIICVDLIVRRFPHMQHFSISESDTFLSASLSLSFGVMSKSYLMQGGYSARQASFMLISLFLVGVVVIRVVSAALHHYIPSHVVDCDHEHDEERVHQEPMAESHNHGERSPLLQGTQRDVYPSRQRGTNTRHPEDTNGRRPSGLGRTLSRTYTRYMQGQKENCDETGPCKGFTDPCGQDCFKAVQRRISSSEPWSNGLLRQPTWSKVSIAQTLPEIEPGHDDTGVVSPEQDARSRSLSRAKRDGPGSRSRSATHRHHADLDDGHSHPQAESADHHHHVPTNAFMSIGLQTSIAIALHKAPEGFITYATNHANPTLGFAVFMALFIHNITEGFAMSLPLYLALNSRLKAIVWSSFLGGVSQPMGAGVAAIWFKLAQHSANGSPDEAVYGGMFAVTAGIMTSVALSLFSESLQMSHKKGICITFAFIGMGVLGLSSALTAV